ncbi:31239_t:CDS:2, partial [Gigaspora margarita]
NLLYNAEGVQKQTPENSSKCPRKMPENLPHNAKGVQEQTPENSLYAQGQMPDNLLHSTREFYYSSLEQMPENLPHNAEVFKNTREFITVLKVPKKQMLESSPPNAKGVQEQTPETSSQCPRTNAREFTTQRQRCIQEHQKIDHSAESAKEQMPENLPLNTEDVQKLTLMKSIIAPKVQKNKMQENSLHNAKSVQGQIPKNTHNAKNAQEQTSEKCPRTHTREFTQC